MIVINSLNDQFWDKLDICLKKGMKIAWGILGIIIVSAVIWNQTQQPDEAATEHQEERAQPSPAPEERRCDPSYPDVCISPSPPDLDCGEITHRNFRVLPPDPHGFDRDKDGIGCEK